MTTRMPTPACPPGGHPAVPTPVVTTPVATGWAPDAVTTAVATPPALTMPTPAPQATAAAVAIPAAARTSGLTVRGGSRGR